jgi:hypothetical protein
MNVAVKETAEKSAPSVNKPIPSVIDFEHKFFSSIDEVSFRLTEDTGDPGMFFKLGDDSVVLSLPGIAREFTLKETDDGDMLQLVARSLKFVAEINIGDPVPAEILTGKASWEVSPRHRELAYSRLAMQLVS